jgi:hypothetical protein
LRLCIVFIVASACGSTPSPQPAAMLTNKPPAEPTCAEVGVILRGEVTADDEAAGPAREKTIADACETDHWPADVIRCAASTVHAEDCLDRLDDAQHASYSARIRAWSDKYEVPEVDAAPDPGLSGEDGLHNTDSIRPPLDDNAPERTWQSELRRRELVAMCERAGWNPLTRNCLAIATTPDAADACLKAELDPAALDVFYKHLDEVAATAKALATLKQTPAKVDCKRVVEAHYADAKWHGKGKADERKQSRAALLSACTTEHWDEFRRACMIVDSPSCAVLDLRWEYPALSDACGEYAVAIQRVGACEALPLTTREALKQAFEGARLGWSNHVNSVEDACRAGANAVIAVLQSAKC